MSINCTQKSTPEEFFQPTPQRDLEIERCNKEQEKRKKHQRLTPQESTWPRHHQRDAPDRQNSRTSCFRPLHDEGHRLRTIRRPSLTTPQVLQRRLRHSRRSQRGLSHVPGIAAIPRHISVCICRHRLAGYTRQAPLWRLVHRHNPLSMGSNLHRGCPHTRLRLEPPVGAQTFLIRRRQVGHDPCPPIKRPLVAS